MNKTSPPDSGGLVLFNILINNRKLDKSNNSKL
jgi:hypothetical protein